MAQTTANSSQIIQENVANMLVKPLETASVILGAGVTIMDSSAPLRIPTLPSGIDNVGFVGEGELIPDDGELTFDEIQLMPSDRKSIKRIVKVTNECIRQASIGVSAELQNAVVTAVKNELDDALLNGDGADKSITGLLNQESVAHAAFDATDPDTIIDAIATMAANEMTPNRLFMSGDDFKAIRKLKDQNGRYIMQSSLADGATYQIHGVPVTVSNKLNAGTAILADMSSIVVVRDIDPTITILNERYAEYDQVGIRVVTRYDMGIIRPEGVLILGAAGE